MRQWSLGAIALSLVLFGVLFVPRARADEYNKLTIVSLPEEVQVPGAVLPAGTYLFKLMDNEGSRTIVQIFNADGTQLVTTIFAIADYRATISDKTIMTFDERPDGQPEALKAWFYPGDNYGVAFLYPKQTAAREEQPAIASPDVATETASANSTATDEYDSQVRAER